MQLELIPGRDATIGDIVANTIGSAVGWVIGRRRPWQRAKAFGLRSSAAVTAVTCGALLAGLFLLRPMLPSPPYYLLWTPKYENQEQYLGRVLSTSLGPLDWPEDSLSMEPGATVQGLLETGPFENRFLAGRPPYYVAPIVTVPHHSERWRRTAFLADRAAPRCVPDRRHWCQAGSLNARNRTARSPHSRQSSCRRSGARCRESK